jgi:hypothetical protein
VIWTHSRSLAGQQGISSPVSLLAGLLAGLFSHLREKVNGTSYNKQQKGEYVLPREGDGSGVHLVFQDTKNHYQRRVVLIETVFWNARQKSARG